MAEETILRWLHCIFRSSPNERDVRREFAQTEHVERHERHAPGQAHAGRSQIVREICCWSMEATNVKAPMQWPESCNSIRSC